MGSEGWRERGTENLPRSRKGSRAHERPMVMVTLQKGYYTEIDPQLALSQV